MKLNFKLSVIIILIIALIHSGYSTMHNVVIPNIKTESRDETITIDNSYSSYRNSLTNAQEIKFYDNLCQAIIAKGESVAVPTGINKERTTAILDYVKLDHPEFYWYDGDYLECSSSIKVLYIKFIYNNIPKCDEVTAVIEDTVEYITNNANEYDNGLSRIAYCYKVITDTLSYNADAEYNQSIYSAVSTGETVCFGYSKLFYACLNKLGFDNYIIVGNSKSENGNVTAHSWNIVKINDNWYYFDLTWGDTENSYNYFLVPADDADFNASHVPDYSI